MHQLHVRPQRDHGEVKDKWTLVAHGVQQYTDKSIEWNYSTGATGPARQSKPKRPPGRRREPPYPA